MSTPETTEFEFTGSAYAAQISPQKLHDEKPVIRLPDGRLVKVSKWFPTRTPRPSVVEPVAEDDKIDVVVEALFLRAIDRIMFPVTRKLSVGEVKSKANADLRLKFEFSMALEDLLDFTRDGFLSWIEDCVLDNMVDGKFTDPQYTLMKVDNNVLTIEADVDVSETVGVVRLRKDVKNPRTYKKSK